MVAEVHQRHSEKRFPREHLVKVGLRLLSKRLSDLVRHCCRRSHFQAPTSSELVPFNSKSGVPGFGYSSCGRLTSGPVTWSGLSLALTGCPESPSTARHRRL